MTPEQIRLIIRDELERIALRVLFGFIFAYAVIALIGILSK